jgi:hypothetical protein
MSKNNGSFADFAGGFRIGRLKGALRTGVGDCFDLLEYGVCGRDLALVRAVADVGTKMLRRPPRLRARTVPKPGQSGPRSYASDKGLLMSDADWRKFKRSCPPEPTPEQFEQLARRVIEAVDGNPTRLRELI